jgi:hypothetical protein
MTAIPYSLNGLPVRQGGVNERENAWGISSTQLIFFLISSNIFLLIEVQ